MKDCLKIIGIHALAWTAFVCYEVWIARKFQSTATPFRFASFYVLNISFFYFHALVSAPYANSLKYPILAFLLICGVEFAVYEALTVCVDIFVTSIEKHHLVIKIAKGDYLRGTWRCFLFMALGTGYFYGLNNYRNLKLKLQEERRSAALESAHLRAQINPHLLFNVISYIYNMVDEIAPKASEALLLLANSMRYAMMPPAEDGLVELNKEIEQIERLIQINQLLSGNKLSIINEIAAECHHAKGRIPPLLLLTFIENMFKHGNLIDAPAIVRIRLVNNELQLHIENLKASRRFYASNNIGTRNATMRLEKFYGNNFILDSRSIESKFIVDLNLKL